MNDRGSQLVEAARHRHGYIDMNESMFLVTTWVLQYTNSHYDQQDSFKTALTTCWTSTDCLRWTKLTLRSTRLIQDSTDYLLDINWLSPVDQTHTTINKTHSRQHRLLAGHQLTVSGGPNSHYDQQDSFKTALTTCWTSTDCLQWT